MRIKELAEKYGVTKRKIEYWTDLGLIWHYQEDNGYREYYGDGEEDVKKCCILMAMGVKDTEMKNYMEMLNCLPKAEWDVIINRIRDNLSKIEKNYRDAINYALSQKKHSS